MKTFGIVWPSICGPLRIVGEEGAETKRLIGEDYPDKVITRQRIREGCEQLKMLVNSATPITLNYIVWNPGANLGFGDHAAIEFESATTSKRISLLIDIGRRPKDNQAPAISVLRVFDNIAFIEYTGRAITSRQNISWLCPTGVAREIANQVLKDMKPFLQAPDADPVEWNFHILFNNCARYAQKRIGESVAPDLRERVLTFREGLLITPTELGAHLGMCDYFARISASGIPLPLPLYTHGYLRILPLEERRAWINFLTKTPIPELPEFKELLRYTIETTND